MGEALIMTALGLAVAVPAVFGYNLAGSPQQGAAGEVRSFSERPADLICCVGKR